MVGPTSWARSVSLRSSHDFARDADRTIPDCNCMVVPTDVARDVGSDPPTDRIPDSGIHALVVGSRECAEHHRSADYQGKQEFHDLGSG